MDLNTILIILGVLALVILVAHGLWSNRREKTQFFKNANTFTRDGRIEHAQQTQHDPLTDVPVQRAAQLHQQEVPLQTSAPIQQPIKVQAESVSQPVQQGLNFDDQVVSEIKDTPHYDYLTSSTKTVEQAVNEIKIRLPGEEHVFEKTSPSYTAPQTDNLAYRSIADIEANIDENEGVNSSSAMIREQLAQASQTSTVKETYVEPKVSRSQPKPQVVPAEPAKQPATESPDFVMLYVVSPENREFYGTHLAIALEELGFVYSEDGIFNRHVDTVATPVIYSVANIRQPGTFDLATMAEFSTIGIVLFMQLSGTARDRMNFLYMCQDAKQFAERLGGFVLDETQEPFTEDAKSRYLARLNQF